MSRSRLRKFPAIWKLLLAVSTVLFSWLAMMIVHEFGHVLHAWASGGRVARVVLHPLEISRTDVEPNPHPLFVAWGGPIWGCVLPAAAWLAWTWRRWAYEYLVRFFAGFCLIANGAYLGAGVFHPVGDAEQLLRYGTPAWVLAVFGVAGVAAGLRMWHGLGRPFGFGRDSSPVDPPAAVMMAAATLLLAAVECAIPD